METEKSIELENQESIEDCSCDVPESVQVINALCGDGPVCIILAVLILIYLSLRP